MTWRAWKPPNACPICGGTLAESGEGKRCTGGFNSQDPCTVYCSNDDRGRPSASRLTFAFVGPRYEWETPEGGGSGGGGSAYWPTGVPSTWREVAAYPYRIDHGARPWYESVRYEAPPEEHAQLLAEGKRVKTFRPRRIRQPRGYAFGLPHDLTRVPYRWPVWRDAMRAQDGRAFYLVEGEKDCEHGYQHAGDTAVFTTAQGGAAGLLAMLKQPGAPRRYFGGVSVLRVVIDRDPPNHDGSPTGAERFAEAVREYIQTPGIVPRVLYLQAAAGKDLADHLAAGLELQDLEPWKP